MSNVVTKREVLFSAIIACVMLILGLTIHEKIVTAIDDSNSEYNTAVKITSSTLFEYGMRTNVGNAFVEGTLNAVDTVSYPEIDGEYIQIAKEEEHYNRHTRTVPHTRSINGHTQTYYTTEVYYSWDHYNTETKTATQIQFLDSVFPIYKINIPSRVYICTIKDSMFSNVRWNYYGTGTKFNGTLYTNLADKTISDNSAFHNDLDIEHTLQAYQNGHTAWLVLFWISWIFGTALLICGFVYLENKWLE